MTAKSGEGLELDVHPLTAERWDDFERLFGARGACGGCWCMWWRLPRREFVAGKGEGNRQAMRALVDAGQVPGLLAYLEGQPVGWCSVAPRAELERLERSRTLRPLDDLPVWSVVCFFVARGYRGRGVSRRLLEAAVNHVRSRGGRMVEAYAVVPRAERMPDVFAYQGTVALYRAAGFVEVSRPSVSRAIMRREVG